MNNSCPQSAKEVINLLFERYPNLKDCEQEILTAYHLLLESFQTSHKLLVCGNGGSAADSEHIVGELMKSFRFKRPVSVEFSNTYKKTNDAEVPTWLEGALPAISLVSQTSLSTAFANDEESVGIFAQQVYGYGKAGDVLLAISTSGNSANVIEAAKVARALNMKVIALTGANESKLSGISNICIKAPQTEVFKIQELHLPIYHCLCAALEAELFDTD